MAKMTRPGRRHHIAALGCALMLGAMASQPVHAHPHVWVTVQTTVLVEQGSVIGFRHRWSFDEMYTAMAIQGLDTNKDGTYSREELAELTQVNMDGLKDFNFFTFAKLGGKDLALGTPKDAWLEHGAAMVAGAAATAPPVAAAPQPENPGMLARLRNAVVGPSKATPSPAEPAKVLTLEFTIPLAQPVLTEARDFSFSVYDPSWFIAFDIAANEAFKLGSGAPSECRLDTGDPAAPGGDEPRRVEEAFSNQFGGAAAVTMSGTKLVKLSCGSKS